MSMDALEILGSTTRAKLTQLLLVRPRFLSELSELLGITPQAVLKHLDTLANEGLVEVLQLKKGKDVTAKQAYYLKEPVSISIEKRRNTTSIHAHFARAEVSSKPTFLREKPSFEQLQQAEDEIILLKRRLKSLREREDRVFDELADVERMRESMIASLNPTGLEEAILRTILGPHGEEELKTMSRYLRISDQTLRHLIARITRG